ncbi:unnamed protein product [Arabidopsis halleri]
MRRKRKRYIFEGEERRKGNMLQREGREKLFGHGFSSKLVHM